MKPVIAFLSVCFLTMSCSVKKSSMLNEDEMFITRKYVGDFIGYSYTKPEKFGDSHLIWIKTSQESTYGRISAFSKTCKFQPGERLYIRKKYFSRGSMWGDWLYQIESDINNTSYMVSKFQYEDKILVQSWF